MRILSKLLGVRGGLERELARVRDRQDDTADLLEEAERSHRDAERRLSLVEARVATIRRLR